MRNKTIFFIYVLLGIFIASSSAAVMPQVSAGYYHTVGLKSDGTVVAVGYNYYGQCNVSGWSGITQVSGGFDHTVGLKSDGTVIAVGRNDYGQCNVSGWSSITQVSAGYYYTIGLKSDGTVVAVGSNADLQCDVSGWSGITQVAAGRYHTVGLKSDGTVVAVGRNDYGQCNVSSWSSITQVSAEYWHTVGLKSDGTVAAVGRNDYSQCNVGGWSGITQVAAGLWYTVGLKSDGTVVAVGYNGHGQCNVSGWSGITQISAGEAHTVGLKPDGTVVAVGNKAFGKCNMVRFYLHDFSAPQVSAGEDHTVGLKTDGTVVAVGRNGDGQCNVSGWSGITQVAGGHSHTVGLKSNGTVVAVGRNVDGQCDVSSWSGITQISAGEAHTVGVKTDGTVAAVGHSDAGQCDVSSWSGITQISAGGYHTVGLTLDGTAVSVGTNYYGQGNVSGWSGITQVAAGRYHTVGLKSDGTVVAVGDNTYGVLNVSGWSGITQVAAGYYHTVGLKPDGTVIAVGDLIDGQCNVSGWSGITQVAAGNFHTVGITSDGTVVAVGDNAYGALNVSGWNIIRRIFSGTVKLNGSGLKDVLISGLPPFSPLTNDSGYYVAYGDSGWTGTAVPAHIGYTFSPTLRNYSNVTSHQFDQDYTATIIIPDIIATSPNGGESWEVGSSHNITWTTSGIVGNVEIEYSTNSGGSWTTIIGSTPNDGSHPWTIPNTPSATCLVQISEAADGNPSNVSDAVFTISLQPAITVTSPNGDENWEVGSSPNITWATSGSVGDVKIEYSTNSGGSWTTIIGSTPNDGSHPWTIPNTSSATCLVQISEAADGNPSDVSDAVFTISLQPAITVTSPNGGENWQVGSSPNITWATSGSVGDVKIEYSTNSGGSWTTIIGSTPNDGSHPWTIPNTSSATCLVQISEAADGNPSDVSDAVFTISLQPAITVTSPNGDENWEVGSSPNITWATSGSVGDVKIEYSTNSGGSWTTIIGSTPNDGSHPWTIPNTSSATCLVQISEAADGNPSDVSDAVFTISLQPAITVTSPNGGESWNTGTAYNITWTTTGTVGDVKIELLKGGSTDSTIESSTSNDGTHSWTPLHTLDTGSDYAVKISDAASSSVTATSAQFTITNTNPATISLDRTQLNFGSTGSSNTTSQEWFRISNIGGGTLSWTATPSESWMSANPGSGTNSGLVNITVSPSGLSTGTHSGTVSMAAPGATNTPQTVNVTFVVKPSSSDANPFGSFDTPIHGSTVMSSVPVTGWALDDVEVTGVKLYRDPISGEGSSRIYIGDAVFIEGARADVETHVTYSTYPFHFQAGWGYMMLTNFLPNQGNGTFEIYAYVTDSAGHEVSLGSKTITCTNSSAVKPFGAIDTPTQGGTASGNAYLNFGWVLTPLPNTIPIDGSTIDVYVDGVNIAHPVYNNFRPDIAALFPGYNNSGGAVGVYTLDTTTYSDGVHTIQWYAEDNALNGDGIGSRYFTIDNSGSPAPKNVIAAGDNGMGGFYWHEQLEMIPDDQTLSLRFKRGYRKDAIVENLYPDKDGFNRITIREDERVEINVAYSKSEMSLHSGCIVAGEHLRPLPIGSTLDKENGKFLWQPGPGFLGEYKFVFLLQDADGQLYKKSVIVTINPKFELKKDKENAKAIKEKIRKEY